MRDITRLLESIPLDELTGDDTMNKRSEIKIKSRAPAIAVAAACALVACGGAVAVFAGRSSAPEKDEAPKTPAAVISEAESEEQSEAAPETTTTTALHTDPVPAEAGEPLAYSADSADRLEALYVQAAQSGDYYDFNKALREEVNGKYLIESPVLEETINFSRQKLGAQDVVDGVDLWVSGYSCSYPFLNVYVAAATRDASPLGDIIPAQTSFNIFSSSINGSYITHHSGGFFEIDGAFGLCSVTIYLNEPYPSESFNIVDGENDITFVVDGLNGREYGSEDDIYVSGTLKAEFKADIFGDRKTIDGLNAPGSWDNKYYGDQHFAMDYTVKKLDYSKSGLAVTMQGNINISDLKLGLFRGENAVAVKHRGIEGADNSEITEACDLTGTNAFVSLIMKDGTVKELEYSNFESEVNPDATVTVYLDMTTFGIDLDNASGIMIGSAEIDF
ncbi:MAG: hypothetical protein IJ746_06670 [Ruminococcus sp.]|nr:hypothetical protein [Ruminococcus sp.]